MLENNNNNNNTTERERQELHKAIWAIADELRGSVDGWEFKNYVLGMMFYRYVSENIQAYVDKQSLEAQESYGGEFKSYSRYLDSEIDEYARQLMIEEKGFFIYPSQLFCNVLKSAREDEELNVHLSKVFKSIEGSTQGAASESKFKGLFDDVDVNSNRLGSSVNERNKRLTSLLDGIAKMKLNYTNGIDAFGDAYEYLMSMYASNAGKSGGEFFTPQEVSKLLALITTIGNPTINKVYDPACGSGSLLLQFAKLPDMGVDKIAQGFYGQEINLTTFNLCRINMFLHNVPFDKFDIANGDTLLNPKHDSFQPFDAVVSNPPYSIHWDGKSNPTLIDDPRYSPAGVLAPESKADLAFVMHCLSYLSTQGTAAIVCFPGIFYRGGAEQKIRKYLIDQNYVDTVIALPSNLFYGTSIATYILVLKKSRNTSSVLFIDASNDYVKVANNNKLTDENINKVIDTIKDRIDIPHYSKNVHTDDIRAQDCNLSVSTYVEKPDTREIIDIQDLNSKIQLIVKRQSELRYSIDEIVSELELMGE